MGQVREMEASGFVPPTYIRFALVTVDPDSNREQGILVAAHQLRDSGGLNRNALAELNGMLDWFNSELPIPKVLEMDQHFRAVSWFVAEAQVAIDKMWELSRILEAHGFQTQLMKSTNPGSIIYRDKFQIVAISKRPSR